MNDSWFAQAGRIVILVGSCMLFSVQARELSLQDAFDLAVQHSHQLKKAKAEREAYESALRAAKAARLPTLSAETFAFYKDEVPSLGITITPDRTFSREIGTHENYQTDLRISVPLFTGGKISGSIKAASAQLDLYRALEDCTLEQLLYQTRIAYLMLYRAERLQEVAQASQDRTLIILKDIRAALEAGTADSTDLLEVNLANNEAFLKLEQAQSARRSAEIKLRTLLNLPATESINVVDKPPPPVGRAVYYTFISKPELRATKAAISYNRALMTLARSTYLPTIYTYAGYSYGKPNIDWFNKTWMDYFSIGAQLSWSLNVGMKERLEERRARYLYQAAQRELDNLTERFEREALLAREQVALARHQYSTAKLRRKTAADNYRLAIRMHRQGALSSNRLLEIETKLSEAEAALETAVVDYHLAESAYFYALGSEQLKEGF
ncbi:MAG: TolC family protein [Candidatus Zixiibacteriota bacterium]